MAMPTSFQSSGFPCFELDFIINMLEATDKYLASKMSRSHTSKFFHVVICDKHCLCWSNPWFATSKRDNLIITTAAGAVTLNKLGHFWAKSEHNFVVCSATDDTITSFNVCNWTLRVSPHFLWACLCVHAHLCIHLHMHCAVLYFVSRVITFWNYGVLSSLPQIKFSGLPRNTTATNNNIYFSSDSFNNSLA